MEKESKILIIGKNLDYCLINPDEEIIRQQVCSNIALDYSSYNYWEGVLESLKIKEENSISGRKLMPFGMIHNIGNYYDYEKNCGDIISYALNFFEEAENYRQGHNVPYVLVGDLSAENISSNWNSAKFSGKAQLMIENLMNKKDHNIPILHRMAGRRYDIRRNAYPKGQEPPREEKL